MKRVAYIAAIAASLIASPAICSEPPASANMLTQGMVQMTLKVGATTQYQVLETFGGPNVSTLDGEGNEVWVYDRFATVSYDKSSGFSIGMLVGAGGGDVAGGAGLGFGTRKSRSEQSSRSMTLIIKFGPDKRVVDFKSRSSSF
ncbi:hypothetical protein GCM10022276_25390 [Sphingomonas limnosediminicola]|uniref:Outer membrane protein assembly factor BamE n=2 Tax=Sphingomonas limnosediminicola TaxID=940133 RepID=A0ABP7LTB2_9SPHN